VAKFQNILLTGINGQVGYELQFGLASFGKVHALDRSQLDLSNPDNIRQVVQLIKPDLIVNPAAYTAVDKAEVELDLANAINAIAPQILAEEAAKLGAAMVHYSTDYVYDGAKTTPYVETDETNPLSIYGKTKLAGEDAIRATAVPHLILRTSWVYGSRGKNFMNTILRLASERESLRIVADQFGAPTSSRAIAEATVSALANWTKDKSGTYHLTCGGSTSWYGFAQAIIEEYELLSELRHWPALKASVANILPITTADYPTPAARPANSKLICDKLSSTFGLVLPEWRIALKQVMAERN
jgi:dTDP-4-dehydrorhamnose reductase